MLPTAAGRFSSKVFLLMPPKFPIARGHTLQRNADNERVLVRQIRHQHIPLGIPSFSHVFLTQALVLTTSHRGSTTSCQKRSRSAGVDCCDFLRAERLPCGETVTAFVVVDRGGVEGGFAG